jgi:hypothetical protein
MFNYGVFTFTEISCIFVGRCYNSYWLTGGFKKVIFFKNEVLTLLKKSILLVVDKLIQGSFCVERI